MTILLPVIVGHIRVEMRRIAETHDVASAKLLPQQLSATTTMLDRTKRGGWEGHAKRNSVSKQNRVTNRETSKTRRNGLAAFFSASSAKPFNFCYFGANGD